MKQQECIVCGKSLTGRQTHFCSTKCENAYHQSYESQQRRGLLRKLQLVQLKGGKCSICGYRKNLSALVFHHADAGEKEFKLDMRSLSNRTLTQVMREVDKCILVCANCHAEIHNANLDLDLLL